MEDPSPTSRSDGATLRAIAPAPSATTTEDNAAQTVNVPQVPERVASLVQRTLTVHNWVELVYQAFGCSPLPTLPHEAVLLGLRGATLAAPKPKAPQGKPQKPAKPPSPKEIDKLEEGIGTSAVEVQRGASGKSTSTYGDLLFVARTPTTLDDMQCVDVFECLISVTPHNGVAQLPDQLEGKQFHAHFTSYFGPRVPGYNDALEVETGVDKRALVMEAARAELALWDGSNASNRAARYTSWYGINDAWCGMFVSYVMKDCYMNTIHYADCWAGRDAFLSGDWGQWIPRGGKAEPGDIMFYEWSDLEYRHTGIAESDQGTGVCAIEGNTGPPSGSQDNGNGLYRKTEADRPRHQISAICRPRYKPIIRWGDEDATAFAVSPSGETILRHHYWKEDAKYLLLTKRQAELHPDKESRYGQFIQLIKSAPNKKNIPYLIVSTKYVLTYSEWVKYITKMDGAPLDGPNPCTSVLRTERLKPQGGIHGGYLPSFMTEEERKKKIDRVNAHYNVAPAGETAAARTARIAERDKALKEINDALIRPAHLPPAPASKA